MSNPNYNSTLDKGQENVIRIIATDCSFYHFRTKPTQIRKYNYKYLRMFPPFKNVKLFKQYK